MSNSQQPDTQADQQVNGGSPIPNSLDVEQPSVASSATTKATRSPKLKANGRPHPPSPASSPRLQSARDLNRPLPPGWERVNSERGIYYWNKETGKTRWKYPEEDAQEHGNILRKHTYVNVKRVKHVVAGAESNKDIALPPRRNSPSQEKKSDHSSRAHDETSEVKVVPVPRARSIPEARRAEQTTGQTSDTGSSTGKQDTNKELVTKATPEQGHQLGSSAHSRSGAMPRQPAAFQGSRSNSSSPDLPPDSAATNGNAKQQPRISRHSRYVNDPKEQPESALTPTPSSSTSSSKPQSGISRHPKYVNSPKEHEEEPSSSSKEPSSSSKEPSSSSKISRHSKYVNEPVEERSGRRRSTGGTEKSSQSQMISRQHRYVNIPPYHFHRKTSPEEEYSSEEDDDEEIGGVFQGEAPPPIIEKLHGNEEIVGDTREDDMPTPTPTSPTPSQEGATGERDATSPTPPIPDRRYSESDTRSPTPPPLPERRYDSISSPSAPVTDQHTYSTIEETTGADAALTKPSDDSLSAPPTPTRNSHLKRKPRVDRRMYETLDDVHLKMESNSKAPPEAKQHRRFTKAKSTDPDGASRPEGAEGTDHEGPSDHQAAKKGRVVQRTHSGGGYALINPAWKRNVKGRPPSMSADAGEATLPHGFLPPPLPDRKELDQPKARKPTIGRYVEVELDNGKGKIVKEGGEGQKVERGGSDPYRDSIAYAIVKLDSLSQKPKVVVDDGQEKRARTPPEPYEVPFSPRGTTERELAPPSYEEINHQDSLCETAGYMVVDRDVQHKLAALQQSHAPIPGLKPPNTASPVALVRVKSPSPPPLPSRRVTVSSGTTNPLKSRRKARMQKSPSSDAGWADSSSSNPPDPKSSSPESTASADTGGYSHLRRSSSPDYMSESLSYNLPANSRRLAAMNVTLRRNPEQDLSSETSGAPPGYSTIGLSRAALLLRSGVTLRRSIMSMASMSPLEQFARQSGYSMDDSGSGSGSQTDEDDSLEPVNKCIKSLETSLKMKDGGRYIELHKPPVGPPKWTEFKRRPHEYEDIKNSEGGGREGEGGGEEGGAEGDNTEAGTRPKGSLVSRSMMNLGVPDMAWDESDIGASSKSKMNAATSISQPNLLSSGMEDAFPHMVQPERVSDHAFNLRKLRLMQHMYEDIDISEWPELSSSTPGDVTALTSAIRSSWLDSEEAEQLKGEDGKIEDIPKGWKVMDDESGNRYYWHVPSGKTQYAKPTREEGNQTLVLSPPPRPDKGKPLDQTDTGSQSPPQLPEKVKTQTFSCRYRGYHCVEESELVPGQCVKVVHACINRTSAAMRTSTTELGSDSWGEKGKVVFLQIQGMELRWLDPETSKPHTLQPINRIRVWGIGLENERDFGYVARDPATKKHKCHVFRCDMPARAVARALLESHQKEKRAKGGGHSERLSSVGGGLSLSQTSIDSRGRSVSPDYSPASESLLDMETRRRKSADHPLSSSHPAARAPRDKYTRITCTYIGSCEVPKATGMEVLNDAVERLKPNQRRWIEVNLDIATSHIKIIDIKTETVIREHRVRFLCFLGIATDDRFCGYVVDGGEKEGEKHFHFHGFRKEPNTDRLCLALHCACQARYQRVLDSNPETGKRLESSAKDEKAGSETKAPPQSSSSSSSSGLFGRLGSFKKTKKLLDEDSRSNTFMVHYLGSLPVAKAEGLETVKEPVQQLSVAKGSSHLVEFEVTATGMSIIDHQKRMFARKTFAVKNITYVVRIRNYFAFIAKESGKYHCHAFKQSEVDTGTIVTTIQRLLAPESIKPKK